MPPTGVALGFRDPFGYATCNALSVSFATPPVHSRAGTPLPTTATLSSPHDQFCLSTTFSRKDASE